MVAFVGINPRTEESGQMKKGWFINRKGNRYLREAAYIVAAVAIKKEAPEGGSRMNTSRIIT